MIDVLQIARSEMPEDIKTMQRTLEHVVEDGRLTDESGLMLESPSHRKGIPREEGPGCHQPIPVAVETLDREFIETGIDALRRLPAGTDLGLPNWTTVLRDTRSTSDPNRVWLLL
jgi:abelson tyrosine-protein kinase 1/abelson tyrosine-protein kinase 2